MTIWIQDSLDRILPEQPPRATRRLSLAGARGEIISFQVGVRTPTRILQLRANLAGSFARHAQVRVAGLVPVRWHTPDTPARLLEGHCPGFVPDPLLPAEEFRIDPNISRSLWITVRLPQKPGTGTIEIEAWGDQQRIGTVRAEITAWPVTLPKLRLPVTNWFYSDALCGWYGIEPFTPRYWSLVEAYMANLVDHHQTAIYTPLFTPPLDHEKRDLQLVEVKQVGPDRYSFGWTKLARWIRLAKSAGFQYFEMSHLFSQWGCAHAIRVLVNRRGKTVALCPREYPATGVRYRRFLEQFLPALLRRLERERILDRCIFHLSDEPKARQLESYRAAREMVRNIAPEIRVTEALSHYDFLQHGLVDNPVTIFHAVPTFLAHGRKPWAYYCTMPRGSYPNRFLDYPLYRVRILGLQMYRFGLTGFLHWGCNYWSKFGTKQPIDPYHVTDGHHANVPAGDPFVVYPGPDGPVDSIRWEVFREAFDDYRLLQAAEKRVGSEKIMRLLRDIVAPNGFPQTPQFIRRVRARVAAIL